MHFKFTLFLAIGVLVITFSGCNSFQRLPSQPTSQPTTLPATPIVTDTVTPVSATAAPVPSIAGLHMLDANNGWGWTITQRLLRTSDGGLTWMDRTPGKGGSVDEAFFSDNQTGWMPIFLPDTHLTGLFHTTDGGQTWSQLSYEPVNGVRGLVRLKFRDATHGWAIEENLFMSREAYYHLSETQDGGVTWKPIAVNPPKPELGLAPGMIHLCEHCNDRFYYDPSRMIIVYGDMELMQPGGSVRMQVSFDLGKNWQTQNLPLPKESADAAVAPYEPIFFDDKNGLLPVDLVKKIKGGEYVYQRLVFYATQDGGSSWSLRSGVIDHLDSPDVSLNMVSPQDVYAYCGHELCASHDGTRTWQVVASNLDFTMTYTGVTKRTLQFLSFLNDRTGWVSVRENEVTTLYKTADGGKTWNKITPSIIVSTPVTINIDTSIPTPTLIPSATLQITTLLSTPMSADISLPLNHSGPWLAYQASRDGFEDQVGEAVVVNPDGSGRRKLADNVWSLMASPTSPYMAVLIQPPEFQGVVTGANTLEIIRLPEMSQITIPLLSSPTIKTFDYRLLKSPQIQDSESAVRVIAWAVSHEKPTWSPDGRYLAFTAAIDGPTADLYVYDTQHGQIRRLTDGPEMATQPEWSPDSQWIVHRGINGYGASCTETGVWAAAVDGSQVKWLNPGECFKITQWIGPHTFETFQPPPGGAVGPNYMGAVKRVDITAGTATFLYMQPLNPKPPATLNCLSKTPAIPPDIQPNSARVESPDGKWFVVVNAALRLFTSEGKLVAEFKELNQFNGWQPDSSALVFTTLGNLPGHRSIHYFQPADRFLKTFDDSLPAAGGFVDQVIWSSAPSSFFLMAAKTPALFYINPLQDQFLQVEASLGKPYGQDFVWAGSKIGESGLNGWSCYQDNP